MTTTVYGIKLNDEYAGFSVTDDIEIDKALYASTPIQVIILATGNEDIRSLVDYFTTPTPDYAIPPNTTLTAEGQLLWDSVML